MAGCVAVSARPEARELGKEDGLAQLGLRLSLCLSMNPRQNKGGTCVIGNSDGRGKARWARAAKSRHQLLNGLSEDLRMRRECRSARQIDAQELEIQPAADGDGSRPTRHVFCALQCTALHRRFHTPPLRCAILIVKQHHSDAQKKALDDSEPPNAEPLPRVLPSSSRITSTRSLPASRVCVCVWVWSKSSS